MDRETVVSQVRTAVIDVLGVEPERVTLEARFAEDLEADSLALVELVMAFEDEFGITVDEDELDAVKTVGDAVDMILRNVA